MTSGVLSGRSVVLGVCGSAAAIKAPALAALLVEAGADVDVVLTEGGATLVGPLAFQALTHRPVVTSLWEPQGDLGMDHLSVAHRASAMIVAPATAHAIARLAIGLADDALTTIALALDGPLLIAPAMEEQMWRHETTRGHVQTLENRHAIIVGPAEGRLASGRSGVGRMAEPAAIVAVLERALTERDLDGRSVIVTAGPTREPLDPVRYLSNRSSGMLGYAIARAARQRGANVTLVTGPVALEPPTGVTVVVIETAIELRDTVLALAPGSDALFMAAAVADYRLEQPDGRKMPKEASGTALQLVPNPDVLRELSRSLESASVRPVLVGFAAETESPWEGGAKKRLAKGLDLVLASQVPQAFGAEEATTWLVTPDGVRALETRTKREIADLLLDEVARLLLSRPSAPPGENAKSPAGSDPH